MEMKITQITKGYKRTINDKNYGSVHVATEVTAEVQVANQEELLEASKKLAKIARVTSQQDYDEYVAAKAAGKVQ